MSIHMKLYGSSIRREHADAILAAILPRELLEHMGPSRAAMPPHTPLAWPRLPVPAQGFQLLVFWQTNPGLIPCGYIVSGLCSHGFFLHTNTFSRQYLCMQKSMGSQGWFQLFYLTGTVFAESILITTRANHCDIFLGVSFFLSVVGGGVFPPQRFPL